MNLFSILRRQFLKLKSDADQTETEAKNFRENPVHGEIQAIGSVDSPTKATFYGTVTSLVVRAFNEKPRVEIVLNDGTGEVIVIWLGRERIHSIVAGAQISVSGFVGFDGAKRIMYNPSYAIHATLEELND